MKIITNHDISELTNTIVLKNNDHPLNENYQFQRNYLRRNTECFSQFGKNIAINTEYLLICVCKTKMSLCLNLIFYNVNKIVCKYYY